jgi:hypothetical protein
MAACIIASLAVAFPFLLIFLEKDRLLAAMKVAAGLTGFFLATALATQVLGIFHYPVIVSTFLLVDLGIALRIFFQRKIFMQGLRRTCTPHSLLAFIAVLAAFGIIGTELYSLHYKYTGEVQTLRGTIDVSMNSSGYPFFSDEWVEAALARHTIESGSLSASDPLVVNKPFADLLAPFHAGLAEAFLLAGLDPTAEFAVLAILTGILVLGAFYMCLRSFGIGSVSSLIVLLGATYIAQAANLPGIWFLLPYLIACIPFFLMLGSFAKKAYSIGYVHALLAIIIYPPIALFVLPSALAASFAKDNGTFYLAGALNRRRIAMASILTVIAVALISILIAALPAPLRSLLFQNISFGIHHASLETGVVSFPIWIVMPFVFLPFAYMGIWTAIRRGWIFFTATAIVGLVFWSLYAFYSGVIVIEYPRVVIITSFILLISAGFGIERCLVFFKDRYPMPIKLYRISKITALACLLLIASLAVPFYARTVLRGQFIVSTPSGPNTLLLVPAPAVTLLLVPDDLRIWSKISDAIFISPPWKGLVIGATSDNYPLNTKSSYITENFLAYGDFMAADCSEKADMAMKYRLSYAYAEEFSCPGFTYVASSSENLNLYHWSRKNSASGI